MSASSNPDPNKSKTKCILFSKHKKDSLNLQPVHLNGDPLPWVKQVKHLGNLLQSDNSMSVDIAQKRGKYVRKVNSLLQEFYFAEPNVLTKLINVYATSFTDLAPGTSSAVTVKSYTRAGM